MCVCVYGGGGIIAMCNFFLLSACVVSSGTQTDGKNELHNMPAKKVVGGDFFVHTPIEIKNYVR